jgi:hypothetical protein
MRWRTANARRKAKAFQARLRRPLSPIRATETGWETTVRVIFTPGMRKTVHVFADHTRPFPPLAIAAGTQSAETGATPAQSEGCQSGGVAASP